MGRGPLEGQKFSDINIVFNRNVRPEIKIQYWAEWDTRKDVEYTKELILNAYPRADIKLVPDAFPGTDKFIITLNNNIIWNGFTEPDNIRADVNDFAYRLQWIAEA